MILDCSGATLQTVLENPYKPTVIKPNISELYQLLNQPLDESLESLKEGSVTTLIRRELGGLLCL